MWSVSYPLITLFKSLNWKRRSTHTLSSACWIYILIKYLMHVYPDFRLRLTLSNHKSWCHTLIKRVKEWSHSICIDLDNLDFGHGQFPNCLLGIYLTKMKQFWVDHCMVTNIFQQIINEMADELNLQWEESIIGERKCLSGAFVPCRLRMITIWLDIIIYWDYKTVKKYLAF